MKTFLFLFFIMVRLSRESLHQPYDTIGNRQECVGVSVSRDDDLKDYGHWLKEWSDFEGKNGLCMWNTSYDILYVEYCVVVNGKKITDSLILSPGTRRTIYFDSKDFKVVYVKAKVYIG